MKGLVLAYAMPVPRISLAPQKNIRHKSNPSVFLENRAYFGIVLQIVIGNARIIILLVYKTHEQGSGFSHGKREMPCCLVFP